ncbi:phage tail tape measure protein [Myroides odoratus]|uniref:Phage-related minor tail protein n=1 Tax=Myroides odoratus TaxID=256 RepID=A0A378RSC0_MYROD|nr:phage tail tape measure protein [Myroides odoratus]QQU04034.1 phage tail tape measure protein [Myroides odoratus]STZ28580.1 Phage-related minor tail protein [Myroides odoratus]
MASLAQINIIFKANLKEFSTEMENSKRQLEKVGKEWQRVGKQMSTYITAPLVALGGISSKINMEFDDSMRKVMATSNATAEEFKNLKSVAEEMGAATRYTASEAAEAMNYMALAGWKTKDIIEGIPGMLALAAASGEDLGMVSDILTDGLTAMGKSASDAAQFVDVLAAASSNSNTTVGMLGEAFQYAAPLAGSLGFAVEDLSLSIGLMSNAGIKGQKAGTALRAILTRLVKPTRESQKAMDDLGITIANADGTIKPLSEVLEILRSKFGNLSTAQKAQYAGMLAGQEAISGFLALVNAAPGDFDALSKAINNSAGTAKRMQDQMEGGIGGSWREMKSALEGVAIQIGEVLEPAFRKVANSIKDLANWFRGLSDTTKAITVAVGGFVAGIGPLMIGVGAVVKVLPVLSAGFVTLKSAIVGASTALLANPYAMVAVALAGLVTYVLLADDGFRKLTSTESNLNDISKQIANTTSRQEAELQKLLKIARDVNSTDKDKIEAIKKINELSPEYLGNITKETVNTDAATVAINKYVAALRNKAKQQAISDKQTVLYSKLLEKESDAIVDYGIGNSKVYIKNRQEFDEYMKSIGASGVALKTYQSGFDVALKKREQEISAIKKQIQYMEELDGVAKQEAVNIEVGVNSDYAKKSIINIYDDYMNSVDPIEIPVSFSVNSEGVGDTKESFLKGTEGFYQNQIKELEKLRSTTAATSDEYALFGEKIAEVQKKIDELTAAREKVTVAAVDGFTPVIAGSTAEMEKQIAVLKQLANERARVYGEADNQVKAWRNEIQDLEIKIKLDTDGAGIQLDKFKESLANTQSAIEGQAEGHGQILKHKQEDAEMYASIVGDSFAQMGSYISSSMSKSENALVQFGMIMAQEVLKMMAMNLSKATADSVSIGTETAKSYGPLSAYVLPALLAASMGAVMSAFSSVPKFADGGIVSGPTFGLMGEYAGAANNPEVIAPLNKLKDLIEPASGGGVTQVVLGGGFKLSGRDLQLVLDRNTTVINRIK